MNYAYNELYLPQAQRMLGDMYDFAVNTVGLELKNFQDLFLVSDISHQIERGNPMYLAGKNGCETAREVIEETTGKMPEIQDLMYLDKSPEYWLGWALSYYQWYSSLPFSKIEEICSAAELYAMYPAYHEADIRLFLETMDERRDRLFKDSQLHRLRKYAKLSQRELAEISGVPLRQIQLFEQGQRDIRKCQGQTLVRIARTLNCKVEDLCID